MQWFLFMNVVFKLLISISFSDVKKKKKSNLKIRDILIKFPSCKISLIRIKFYEQNSVIQISGD